jgi:hypothetical protein
MSTLYAIRSAGLLEICKKYNGETMERPMWLKNMYEELDREKENVFLDVFSWPVWPRNLYHYVMDRIPLVMNRNTLITLIGIVGLGGFNLVSLMDFIIHMLNWTGLFAPLRYALNSTRNNFDRFYQFLWGVSFLFDTLKQSNPRIRNSFGL